MHDPTLWGAWYLLLLVVPLALMGALIRELLSQRRSRHRH